MGKLTTWQGVIIIHFLLCANTLATSESLQKDIDPSSNSILDDKNKNTPQLVEIITVESIASTDSPTKSHVAPESSLSLSPPSLSPSSQVPERHLPSPYTYNSVTTSIPRIMNPYSMLYNRLPPSSAPPPYMMPAEDRLFASTIDPLVSWFPFWGPFGYFNLCPYVQPGDGVWAAGCAPNQYPYMNSASQPQQPQQLGLGGNPLMAPPAPFGYPYGQSNPAAAAPTPSYGYGYPPSPYYQPSLLGSNSPPNYLYGAASSPQPTYQYPQNYGYAGVPGNYVGGTVQQSMYNSGNGGMYDGASWFSSTATNGKPTVIYGSNIAQRGSKSNKKKLPIHKDS